MSSIGKSYSQWASALKQELFYSTKSARSVFVHKAKLSALNNEINEFYKKFMKKQFQNTAVPKDDEERFASLNAAVTNLKALYDSLSEKQFFSTITTHGLDYVNAQIKEFQTQFNNYASALKLIDSPLNNADTVNSDKADCVHLRQSLLGFSTQAIAQSYIIQLNQRIEALDSNEGPQEAPKDGALSEQEIDDGLKEFSSFSFKPEEFQLKKKNQSRTAYSSYQAFQKSNGMPVYVKKLRFSELSKPIFENFVREVSILSKIKHFTCPKFIGFTKKAPFYFVSEMIPGDILFQRLHGTKAALNSTQLTIIALGIAYGMAYLHSENILHRDLKAVNILLDSDDFPHLSDFSSATFIAGEQKDEMVGTKPWMAPEVLEKHSYSTMSDVYSYGMVLYEMLTNETPFQGVDEEQLLSIVQKGKRPQLPTTCSAKLSSLIQKCWDSDPNKRPTFASIVIQFESGDVSFPDANLDLIEAYKEKFSGSAEAQINKFDVNSANIAKLNDVLDSIMLDDEKKQMKAITIANEIVNNPTWKSVIAKSDIIQRIPKMMQLCITQAISFGMIKLTAGIITIHKLITNESTISKSIITLFGKFGGQPALNDFIEALFVSVQKETQKPKFSPSLLEYINTFLVSKNAKIKDQTFLLLHYIFENNLLESSIPISIAAIPNLFKSYLPIMTEEHTLKVINLITDFSKTEQCIPVLELFDIPSLLIPHCLQPKHSSEVMTLLLFLASSTSPTQKFAKLFISEFSNFISHFQNETMIRPLLVLSTLILTQATYTQLVESPDAIKAIEECLKNQDIKVEILALKLSFVFYENETSSKSMMALVPCIKSFLHKEKMFSILAASCLVVAIAHAPASFKSDKEIVAFIKSSLEGDLQDQTVAIRLVGVFGQTYEGSKLLQQSDCFPLIFPLVHSTEKSIKYLSLAAITVLSASVQYLPEMKEVVEIFFSLPLEDRAYSFIHSFSANISESLEGAAEVAVYLPRLIEESLNRDKLTTAISLSAIQNVTSFKEAAEIIRQPHIIKLFSKLIPLSTKGFGNYVFHIIGNVIDFPESEELRSIPSLNKVVETVMRSIPENHNLQSILLHIQDTLTKT